MKIKALVLLSGGLDSTLAAKLLINLGMDLEAIYFYTVFCTCNRAKSDCQIEAKRVAQDLGIPLKIMNISQEYLELIKRPKYGYGSHLNPCIDCRIFTFSRAKDYMKEIGAQFIVTGEVLGERPMSQRLQAMKIIEKESGLQGLILRPLSARLLQPSQPEIKGWVKRDKLFSIQGRSRKSQIELAKRLGIKDYLCPAGGCLLTDPIFSRKLKNLIAHNDLTLENIYLLKSGRFFRLATNVKLFVGRNREENHRLLGLAREKDLIFRTINIPGPVGVARGEDLQRFIREMLSIVASYADGDGPVEVEISSLDSQEKKVEQIKKKHKELIQIYKV